MRAARTVDIAAIGTLGTALVAALVVPPDSVQGDLQRIMYVHVPSAWLAYLAFSVTLVGSIAFLRTRALRWDRLAASAAELGVVFTGLALVTGSIWGKPVWGVWWTWDARLVLTAVMFFVYLGYLALRRSLDDPGLRARRAAVLGILGAAQIPIVHFSVTWWRGLHQPPTVLRPDGPQLDAPLLFALFMSVVAFTIVFAALVRRRIELARWEEAAIDGEDARLAGDAVGAPSLEAGHR